MDLSETKCQTSSKFIVISVEYIIKMKCYSFFLFALIRNHNEYKCNLKIACEKYILINYKRIEIISFMESTISHSEYSGSIIKSGSGTVTNPSSIDKVSE